MIAGDQPTGLFFVLPTPLRWPDPWRECANCGRNRAFLTCAPKDNIARVDPPCTILRQLRAADSVTRHPQVDEQLQRRSCHQVGTRRSPTQLAFEQRDRPYCT
jgi:hypothetical protein